MTLPLLVVIPYLLLLFTGLLIPSDGKHGLFNPKSLAFVISSVTIAISFLFQTKISPRLWNLTLFFFTAIAFLINWLLIGISSGQIPLSLQFDQMKLFFITLTLPLMTAYLIDYDYLTPAQFYRAVFYFSFIYMTLKCLLVLLHFIGIVDIWHLLESAGFRAMSMNITEGISRLQTSVDIFTPFILFFVLQASRLNIHLSTWFRTSYLLIALASTFLSFSRYLIAIYAISFLLYWLTLNARKTILNFLFGSVFLFTTIAIIGPSRVQKVVELRLVSRNTIASDNTRKSQITALLHEFEQSPYLGKGLGAFAPTNIRDPILKYSYEVQWVALLMQFGLIGTFLLLLPLTYIAFQILNSPPSPVKLPFFLLYLLWLLSGFTNPFLLSLGSGILYTCFYLLPESLKSYCAKSTPSLTIPVKPK